MSSPRTAILLIGMIFACSVDLARAEILINFQPSQSNGTAAQSLCQCAFANDNAILHWSCEPFAHSISTETRSDATLSAMVTAGAGNISVTPLTASDQTNYSSGDDSADVVMTMGGTGTVDVVISVAIDPNTSAAGSHSTTVFLTVTSN